MPSPVIALLTDFGADDAFVGIMKGVILGINPEVAHRRPDACGSAAADAAGGVAAAQRRAVFPARNDLRRRSSIRASARRAARC